MWHGSEVEKFARVSADPANGFVFCLKKLALKKSSNNEVYEQIKKELGWTTSEERTHRSQWKKKKKKIHRQRKSDSL